MTKNYYYETCCVYSTAEAIISMVDQAREITWRTFLQYVPVEETQRIFPMYSYRGELYNKVAGWATFPMHIKNDYVVSFHKSRYEGRRCYYIDHNRIEYIFTKKE